MACKSFSLTGIDLGCKDHMGGIKEVYLIQEADIAGDIGIATADEAAAPSANVEEGQIKSINLAEGKEWKVFKFRKGTGQMTSTATSDESVGTFSVQTDLSLQFSTMDSAKRLQIMAMCYESLKAVVLDSNGKYWFLGYDYPISASAAGAASGLAYGDFGGYTVTLTDNSKEFPHELSPNAVTALRTNIGEIPMDATE